MYQIGLFSKINKVTVKTLRYYDKIGLLKPAFIDPENNYRYYTSEQLPILHKILSLKQLDFSIKEISDILDGRNIEEILEKRKISIECEIRVKKEFLQKINYFLNNNEEGELNMVYQAVIKELPEVTVFSRRMKIPDYDSYFNIIPEIGEKVKKANPELKCAVPEYCFIIYHDGEYKEKDIDVEFCEAVTDFGKNIDDIVFKKIDKVKEAVSVLHKGPYSTIRDAYSFAFRWIEQNGYKIADNPRESYIDGIWNKEDESEWLTELQIPVKR